MSLPKPHCSFALPSLHDDMELACRIYYPRRTDKSRRVVGKAFAIVAHPYAPLGGSYDDHVVGLAGNVLLQSGFVLATFNFRGASGSAGRTSWSGKAELADYVSVYGFLACYIQHLSQSGSDRAAGPGPEEPLLILGGYSYGSMIASHLPPLEVVIDRFLSAPAGSAAREIQIRARDLSRDFRAYMTTHMPDTPGAGPGHRDDPDDDLSQRDHRVSMGGYESNAASRRISHERSRKSIDGERVKQSWDRMRGKLNNAGVSRDATSPREPEILEHLASPRTLPATAYLLISPLLPPVAGLITMFSKLRYVPPGETATSNAGDEFDQLTSHPCCCLYGSADGFTSENKLRRWIAGLESRPGSQVATVRADTGHFWQDADAVQCFRRGLADWLNSLVRRFIPVDNLAESLAE